MKNNVAIIGFMGSGKTTVSKLLAERLSYLFIDFDRVIELSESRTIKDIFEEKGENYFREIESKIIRKILNNKHCIFACGGGVVVKRENMKLISKNCEVVYMMISPEEAFKRLSQSRERPLLPDKKRKQAIRDLLEKRQRLYSKYATITVDNNNIAPEAAVEEITRKLRLVTNTSGHA